MNTTKDIINPNDNQCRDPMLKDTLTNYSWHPHKKNAFKDLDLSQ
jgi:hypothetical protein